MPRTSNLNNVLAQINKLKAKAIQQLKRQQKDITRQLQALEAGVSSAVSAYNNPQKVCKRCGASGHDARFHRGEIMRERQAKRGGGGARKGRRGRPRKKSQSSRTEQAAGASNAS